MIFLSPPLLRCHLLPASTSLQHLTKNSNGTGPRVSHSHLLLSGYPLRLKLRPPPGVPSPSLLKHSGANAPKSAHSSPLAHPGHPRLPVPWQWPHHCPPCLHGPSCKRQPQNSRVTLPLRGFWWFPTVRRMESNTSLRCRPRSQGSRTRGSSGREAVPGHLLPLPPCPTRGPLTTQPHWEPHPSHLLLISFCFLHGSEATCSRASRLISPTRN